MRILVAEDDDTNALLIGRMLKKAGYEFDRARDGIEALEFAGKGHYAAVLSDWMMPRMDGLELIKELRRRLRPTPPLIILTATASDEARNRVLDAGADEYLAKPVRADELARCIERALGRNVQKPSLVRMHHPATGASLVTDFPLVLFVAGTGGPVAIQKILCATKSSANACYVVIQHGPAWMLETFCHRLQAKLNMQVTMAEHGTPLKAGWVLLAPGGQHVSVSSDGRRLELSDGDEVNLARPSADVLFDSAAPLARYCMAVVLTGAGCDGANGCHHLATLGATVFIQDPASAEVPAMPQNVIASGMGPRVVPLPQLAQCLDAAVLRLAGAGDLHDQA